MHKLIAGTNCPFIFCSLGTGTVPVQCIYKTWGLLTYMLLTNMVIELHKFWKIKVQNLGFSKLSEVGMQNHN